MYNNNIITYKWILAGIMLLYRYISGILCVYNIILLNVQRIQPKTAVRPRDKRCRRGGGRRGGYN